MRRKVFHHISGLTRKDCPSKCVKFGTVNKTRGRLGCGTADLSGRWTNRTQGQPDESGVPMPTKAAAPVQRISGRPRMLTGVLREQLRLRQHRRYSFNSASVSAASEVLQSRTVFQLRDNTPVKC